MKIFNLLITLLCLTISVQSHADGPARKDLVDAENQNDPAPEEDTNACLYPEVIGKKPDEVMTGHFPDDAFIRVLQPGQMVTMEYRFGRINLNVDDNGVIVSVTCG